MWPCFRLKEFRPPPKIDRGPRVQFAQFVDGGRMIQPLWACTKDISYFAISHVWGKIEWRPVACLDYEIKASPQKAKFIDERLYDLVGEVPFWMDTITVNQKDQEEVISTVQAIPRIFQDAEKTIAVREGDGMYNCCLEAVRGWTDYTEMKVQMMLHVVGKHWGDIYTESYLDRLWTLQECLLSHTIEFTVGTEGAPVRKPQLDWRSLSWDDSPVELDSDSLVERDLYWKQQVTMRIVDALYTLAQAFVSGQNGRTAEARLEFMKAYMSGGTVCRTKPLVRRADEDIFSDSFLEFHKTSMRAATEPRDYIFAAMPQFPWYSYPVHAKAMSFNDIFADFHRQATAAGHGFTSRITKSMTHADCGTTQEEAWSPSIAQPEPRHLGDFLKLLGDRLDSSLYHLATGASVAPVICADDTLKSTLALIESAMKFSPDTWSLSQQGGELGKYGGYPERPEHGRTPRFEDEIDRQKAEEEREKLRHGTEDWNISQAMRIICLMFGALDSYQINQSMRIEWPAFLIDYKGCWSTTLQHVMIIHAAMISCQIPLSAYHWLREKFVPVHICLPRGLVVLGLLSKLAMNSNQPGSEHTVFVAGRHTSLEKMARDIVLVNPDSNHPIGLLPDFTHFRQTREETLERTKLLYGDRIVENGEQVAYSLIPLDGIRPVG